MPGTEQWTPDGRPVDDVSDDVAAALAEVRDEGAGGDGAAGAAGSGEPQPRAGDQGTDETATQGQGRVYHRGERGRFASPPDKTADTGQDADRQQQLALQKPGESQQKPTQTQDTQQPDAQAQAAAAAAANRPPPGWSVAAKSKWDALPAEVREAIGKRETEVNNGFAQLRDYKDLRPYVEMAHRSGTSLPEALERYVGIEQTLRSDPLRGILTISQNIGINPVELAQTILAHAGVDPGAGFARNGHAGANGGPSAAQNGLDLDPALLATMMPVVQPLMKRIDSLQSHFDAQERAHQNRVLAHASSISEQMRADPKYRYYDDLEETIGNLLEKGMVQRTGDMAKDLAAAYDMAAWQHPEVREALINERSGPALNRQRDQDIAARARNASRSIRGSAAPGTVIADDGQAGGDLEATVRAAFRAHS